MSFLHIKRAPKKGGGFCRFFSAIADDFELDVRTHISTADIYH